MSATDLTGVVIAMCAFVGLVLNQANTARQLRREADIQDELVRNRLTAIEVKVDVFWTGLMKDTAKILHQETEIERDALLEKLLADEINQEEIEELRIMLKHEINKPDTARDMGPKMAAAVLLNLLDAQARAAEVMA